MLVLLVISKGTYHNKITFPILKPQTHYTIFGCPRWKIDIGKQSWRFLWPWLLIGALMSHSERGSKTAVVVFLRSKIAYYTAWSSHSVFVTGIHVYWPTNKNVTWNQRHITLKHKTAYLLSLPLLPFPLFYCSETSACTIGWWFSGTDDGWQ